ncbi:alpha/beta fold hydrolase [Mycobacteroides chelonae]|nr:alpha/beta fold hydrolase [Mycobacteroides chelonae]MEC4842289.1 alpha/beta fold hydrolase [Mycobacteroides chelonae]MEC4847129.1 alpha/beta fold hydrolase [Mycobacteroides chelonae]MEC4856258.1 alpha/beta fold hydrolase [Mycobacteroides chelonae]
MTASTAKVGDIELCFEEFGNPADPAVLLIMGIGAQMVFWRTEFCQQLAGQGYRVIRFDNRDCGLSTKLDGVRAGGGALIPTMAKFLAGVKITDTAYTLVDMAADAAGLLDHLGIEQAHIVGASMGGMIAQVFAAEHPDRTQTVTIIMSSNNQPFLPPPGPRQLMALLKPRRPAPPARRSSPTACRWAGPSAARNTASRKRSHICTLPSTTIAATTPRGSPGSSPRSWEPATWHLSTTESPPPHWFCTAGPTS